MSNIHNLYSTLNGISFFNIVGVGNFPSDYFPIDLSINSKLIKNLDLTNSSEMELLINQYLKKNKSKVAYGGYLENRNLYQRSDYFNSRDENERTIHLGIDFWCAAGTSVFAPLDGIIHSFQYNTNFGDYGPTIILSHVLEGIVFYTLYGHLSLDSLEELQVGKQIKKGDKVAFLGDSSINGNYAPHLHFQLILDMQGKLGDYPGVCAKNEVDFYQSNCPNPLFLLGL